ncbi:hypothetical protein Scep_022622 [Stephania cephalantha]|uniref:MPN domain-containing protein n=1 Tax=Stephania cephalantha TaxID=152367 RepID=A0AAP0HXZ4_9MAGN
MRTSNGGFSIAANTRKLEVDNRIALRYYYRIADNLLKQADIFREEKNVIDLYIMLLRFSGLITETIPCHRDYKSSLQREKILFKKKLLHAMNELEILNPIAKQKVEELNVKNSNQVSRQAYYKKNDYFDSSSEWPSAKDQISKSFQVRKALPPVGQGDPYRRPQIRSNSSQLSGHVEGQFQKLSLGILRPKEETLSRHSILGPNGLRGQWQPPISKIGVQYPTNLDLTPIEFPSLQQPLQDDVLVEKDTNSDLEKSTYESVLSLNVDNQSFSTDISSSLDSLDKVKPIIQMDIVRQPSPPPMLADVQDLIPAMPPQVTDLGCKLEDSLQDELIRSKSPLELHISTSMMDNFMRLAKVNTDRNLETCGVLAGSLKNKKFFVTALIIPKQESTSDSCQATNEEEIFDVQDKQSLFPLGWIHTHPSQSCFMSSIDVHTHYSYQIMLPEAIAIVMAPKDSSRKHGIFRLTSPGGISVIRNCDRRGFHPHEPPPDGGPIYDHCTDVYMNPNLKFDVIDLR